MIKIYCDGGARGNPGPAAAGVVIEGFSKEPIELSKYLGRLTNNQAEYRAVLLALEWLTVNLKDKGLPVGLFLDSELVIRQLKGEYRVKNQELKALYREVQSLIKDLKNLAVFHLPRSKNRRADWLVNRELDQR